MRVGVLSCGMDELDWLQKLGFRSMQWMRFDESPAAAPEGDWRPFVEQFAAETQRRDVRVSAIGAYYKNPLDPSQTAPARAMIQRAIEVAAFMGVKTVGAFAGAVIELENNERG